jgi:Rieske Fe-S protein
MEKPTPSAADAAVEPRRGFGAQLAAGALAVVAFAVPVVTSLAAALNPLRQKGRAGKFYRLASLDALPEDGTPQKVAVVAERVNAWTRSVEPIGAVYLIRSGADDVRAIQVVCPHAGCSVEFKEIVDTEGGQKQRQFVCPCHKAHFDLEGKRLDAVSASPRDLDTLEVEIRDQSEVWVQFQNFQLGTASKVPVA